MRLRWWHVGLIVALGALVVGAWWLSRPPSLGWTAEEIAAEQRALVEASMPEGEAAWPLIEEAVDRAAEIASAWPAPMSDGWWLVVEPLRRLDWTDPRLAPGKAAFAELAPVIDLLIEASFRKRMFRDGRTAAAAGAFLDESAAGRVPAVQTSVVSRLLLTDARLALAEGDQAVFVERLEAVVRLADLASQAPLLLTQSSVSLMRSLALEMIIDGVREARLSSETCASLRRLALRIRDAALRTDEMLFKGERLWTYAEALRMIELAQEKGISERLVMRWKILRGGRESLGWSEESEWAWMEWLASHSGPELRRRIDENERAMTAWWNTPASERSATAESPLGFPGVSYADSGRVIANIRGGKDIVAARAVGVAALLDIESHEARKGSWPESLAEAPDAAALRDPISGAAVEYTREALEGWPFTLRLAIDSETMERLQPVFMPLLLDDIERPDERLITRPAWTLPPEELEVYEWLQPEED